MTDICCLQRELLPDSRCHDLRTVQNWIGGGEANPLDAVYVPPPPGQVADLMDDLTGYINSAGHGPLIQAGLAHAQFETIHPFTDGNGRIGRALIHTILTRRGLTRTAVLPISLALQTKSTEYIDGLGAYRYSGSGSSFAANEAVHVWLTVFLCAAEIAVDQAGLIVAELEDITAEWKVLHQRFRESAGMRAHPRDGSTVKRLLDLLPAAPMLTARSVQCLLDVTHPAARSALEELAGAGILTPKSVERGTTGYLASDIFRLITHVERQLATTQWDTKMSRPVRPVSASPQRNT